jgi:hypothetical protein
MNHPNSILSGSTTIAGSSNQEKKLAQVSSIPLSPLVHRYLHAVFKLHKAQLQLSTSQSAHEPDGRSVQQVSAESSHQRLQQYRVLHEEVRIWRETVGELATWIRHPELATPLGSHHDPTVGKFGRVRRASLPSIPGEEDDGLWRIPPPTIAKTLQILETYMWTVRCSSHLISLAERLARAMLCRTQENVPHLIVKSFDMIDVRKLSEWETWVFVRLSSGPLPWLQALHREFLEQNSFASQIPLPTESWNAINRILKNPMRTFPEVDGTVSWPSSKELESILKIASDYTFVSSEKEEIAEPGIRHIMEWVQSKGETPKWVSLAGSTVDGWPASPPTQSSIYCRYFPNFWLSRDTLVAAHMILVDEMDLNILENQIPKNLNDPQ